MLIVFVHHCKWRRAYFTKSKQMCVKSLNHSKQQRILDNKISNIHPSPPRPLFPLQTPQLTFFLNKVFIVLKFCFCFFFLSPSCDAVFSPMISAESCLCGDEVRNESVDDSFMLTVYNSIYSMCQRSIFEMILAFQLAPLYPPLPQVYSSETVVCLTSIYFMRYISSSISNRLIGSVAHAV